MNFYNQKLFVPYDQLLLPSTSPNGKSNCFYFYGENVNFIETYNFLKFQRQYLKYVFVPSVAKPRSFLTPEYFKILRDRNLLPVKGRIGEYSKLHGLNFFFDATKYLEAVDKQYKVKRFNSGYGANLYNQYINSIAGIDKTAFDTTILYAVNTDKPISNQLMFKKGFILYNMLLEFEAGKIKELPFERIILFLYNKDGGKYIKIYDKESKNNNYTRVKQIVTKLQQATDGVTEEDNQAHHASIVASVESKLVDKKHEEIVQTAIKNYTKADAGIDREKDYLDSDKLVTRALVYNMVGDIDESKKIAKKIDRKLPEKRKEILSKIASQLIPRPPAENSSTNYIIKSNDVPRLLDYQSPAHILEKRKTDFRVNLKSDISDAFALLADKDVPLTLKNIEIKEVRSGPSEIYKTIKDRYNIDLQDAEGNIHNVHVDIPHLTENGSFLVNGQQKILINQLVRFPIFFPAVNVGRFESSYSVMKIHSKALQNGAYIIGFLGSYKFPILMYLATRYGLTSALSDYGVTYKIE